MIDAECLGAIELTAGVGVVQLVSVVKLVK